MKRVITFVLSVFFMLNISTVGVFGYKQDNDEQIYENERVIQTLKTLGATSITVDNDYVDRSDIYFDDFAYCLRLTELETSCEYALVDSNDHIVYFDRGDDVIKERLTGRYNVSFFSSVDEVLQFVKANLMKDGYVETYAYNDENTPYVQYQYEKDIGDGFTNGDDFYVIMIDKPTKQLMGFSYHPDYSKKEYCTGQVVDISKIQKNIYPLDPTCTVTMTTTRPSQFSTDYYGEDAPVLSYVISSNYYGTVTYVDANSGGILGEDILKLTAGCVASSHISFAAYAYSSLNSAHNGFTTFGYSSSRTYSSNFASDIINYLGNAFYVNGHGSSTTISAASNDGHAFSYTSVPTRNYFFVFLDACNTGTGNYWSTAFSIDNETDGRLLLGWSNTVTMYYANAIVTYIFGHISRSSSIYSIYFSAVSTYGSTVALNFKGDGSIHGYVN